MKIPSVADDFAELEATLGLSREDRRRLLPHIQRAFYVGYMVALNRSVQASLRPAGEGEAWFEAAFAECDEFAALVIAQCDEEGGRGKG